VPSPFPGMDPYLERPAVWSQFHGEFVYRIRKHVADVLPPNFLAIVDRHVYVVEPDEDREPIGRLDSFVIDEGPADDVSAGPATATLAAPFQVTLPQVRREGNRFIRIVNEDDRRVVTVVEVLSPSNKRTGQDRENYLAKRSEYLALRLNLVEIDFLRGGMRMPMDVPPAADYLVLVSRPASYPSADVWSFGVRDRLPTIPVPLGPESAEPVMDLAAPLREAYDDGRYGRLARYNEPLSPPLREPDATWARDLLAARPKP
jgi:hypothetical protein